MALLKDQVIVLKAINYSEADKIITVFGRNKGRFAILAKGVRKLESKNRGNIQTGTLSKISYYDGQNLGILRESESIIVPEIDKSRLGSLNNILYLLYKLMPEDQEDSFVFKLIAELYSSQFTLRDVNKFRIKTLRHLGYLPDLTVCSICNKENVLKMINIKDLRLCCTECFGMIHESELPLWEKISDMKYESQKMNLTINEYVKRIVEEI